MLKDGWCLFVGKCKKEKKTKKKKCVYLIKRQLLCPASLQGGGGSSLELKPLKHTLLQMKTLLPEYNQFIFSCILIVCCFCLCFKL